MKDRIKQFIDYKGITPGDLASALDVQRSNISHILNGRNKPGAVFIEKMLLVYPDLNARWLLTGAGNMITVDNSDIQDVSEKIPQKEKEIEEKEAPAKKEIKAHNDSVKSEKEKPKGDLDKIVLLFADGTFTSYNPK